MTDGDGSVLARGVVLKAIQIRQDGRACLFKTDGSWHPQLFAADGRVFLPSGWQRSNLPNPAEGGVSYGSDKDPGQVYLRCRYRSVQT